MIKQKHSYIVYLTTKQLFKLYNVTPCPNTLLIVYNYECDYVKSIIIIVVTIVIIWYKFFGEKTDDVGSQKGGTSCDVGIKMIALSHMNVKLICFDGFCSEEKEQ